MRNLFKKQGFAPKLLITDKPGSFGAVFRRRGLTCPHDQGLRKNNRAENSHLAAPFDLNSGVRAGRAQSRSGRSQTQVDGGYAPCPPIVWSEPLP